MVLITSPLAIHILSHMSTLIKNQIETVVTGIGTSENVISMLFLFSIAGHYLMRLIFEYFTLYITICVDDRYVPWRCQCIALVSITCVV